MKKSNDSDTKRSNDAGIFGLSTIYLKRITLAVFAVFAVLVVLLITQNDPAPENKVGAPQTSKTGASFYLTTASKDVKQGAEFTFDVWSDSQEENVNAVQANINYPADKFDFVKVDGSGSAFELEAQATGGDGQVQIGRAHIGDLRGKQFVSKVTLKSKANSGEAKVTFGDGTSIVRTSDNTSVLKSTYGLEFNLTN